MPADYSIARRKLICRYAIFSSSLLIAFASSVYLYVRSGRQAFELVQIKQLAADAASQLPLLRHELEEASGRPTEAGPVNVVQERTNHKSTHLDDKQIRWFNPELKEISRYGNFTINAAIIPPVSGQASSHLQVFGAGLSLWRPVFTHGVNRESLRLEGYVSVLMSSEPAIEELMRLRNGLFVGAGLSAALALLASQWMVSSSLSPVRDHIHRLHQFTADASHELRNPLTAIRSVIGSMRYSKECGYLTPFVVDKLRLVDEAVAQMARLIDDLLMIARLDKNFEDRSGWNEFCLEDLIEDIVDLYRGIAQERQLTLHFQECCSVKLMAHPGRLKQLIVNLLVNAIRFSPMGGTVTVGLRSTGRWAEVWVDDEGPGIPKEERDQVFERFWQGDKARSRAGHFGLGLAMARAIAESHGGQIMALSKPNPGCRMLLRLPLR
ncbi:MAG: HAMP domain-containing sensor histidine kinase [Cyanobacteria bacterium]|nr:HAMP domain-containing sensor histidine kinase [Cyanobacteriota bacterium]